MNIRFHCYYPGCINLIFEIQKVQFTIWLSSIFDPLPSLIKWYNTIKEGRQASVSIDEEGVIKNLNFQKHENSDLWEFIIIKENFTSPPGFILKFIISRESFLKEMEKAFFQLTEAYGECTWHTGVSVKKRVEASFKLITSHR